MTQINSIITRNGRPPKREKYAPKLSDKPLLSPPLASANPPPNRKIILNGMFSLINFHVIKPFEFSSGASPELHLKNFIQSQRDGSTNKAVTIKMDSDAFPISNCEFVNHPCMIPEINNLLPIN